MLTDRLADLQAVSYSFPSSHYLLHCLAEESSCISSLLPSSSTSIGRQLSASDVERQAGSSGAPGTSRDMERYMQEINGYKVCPT